MIKGADQQEHQHLIQTKVAEPCDDEASGYFRDEDGIQCKKLFSTQDCDPGKWFVFDESSKLYKCAKHPCGNNLAAVPLRTGQCVDESNIQLVKDTIPKNTKIEKKRL
jgi:hypothetical protein